MTKNILLQSRFKQKTNYGICYSGVDNTSYNFDDQDYYQKGFRLNPLPNQHFIVMLSDVFPEQRKHC
jgi:hypothetical protein